jgi:hypothetical protein
LPFCCHALELRFAVAVFHQDQDRVIPGMRFHPHLSDLRIGLLLRGASITADDDVLRKADTCAKTLGEARRLVALQNRSPLLEQLLSRARELLDDLDVSLLALSHDRDRAVFMQLAVLRDALNELQAWLSQTMPQCCDDMTES